MIPNYDFEIDSFNSKYSINNLFTWRQLESMFQYESINSFSMCKNVKPLPNNFNKNGYTYIQVCRGDKSVIYAQWDHNKTIAYEVFIIKIKKAYKIKGKSIKARERIPNNEAFGYWAWTYKTLDKAKEKYNILENHFSKK